MPPGWLGHVQLLAENPRYRAFVERLASRRRVVTYDRVGTGLSDRRLDEVSIASDVEQVCAVARAAGLARFDLFAFSQGGAVSVACAARHPELVRRLVLYGAFARGSDVATPALRAPLIALVRANWGLGSSLLAELFIPDRIDEPEAARWFAQFERASCDAETAARLLEGIYEADVAEDCTRVRAPVLVVHRRGDRAIPASAGRELAARIPRARLVMHEGKVHLPWLGDSDTLLDTLEEFFDAPEHTLPVEPTPPPSIRISARRSPGSLVHGHSRVALAQMSVPLDAFEQSADGLLRMQASVVPERLDRIRRFAEEAAASDARLLVLPELAIDSFAPGVLDELLSLCRTTGLVLVAGGAHDPATRRNVARVLGPDGLLWEQPKHVPAMLRLHGALMVEGIAVPPTPEVVVGDTPAGRIAIAICRDFLDLDVRASLRHAEPAPDLLLNPAFTPVTADFAAAHFEARRSIYAYSCFCNAAEFGGTLVHAPERKRGPRPLAAGAERLLLRDVDLLGLRESRERWAEARRKTQFIQSTR